MLVTINLVTMHNYFKYRKKKLNVKKKKIF
jgi:hypothetical protein